MGESDTFKSNVIKTLCDPTVSMINFTVHNIQISTICYVFIAKFIFDGRIKCVVDSSVAGGTAAEYSPSDDTIYGSESGLDYFDQKATIFHECTHAYFDLVKGYQSSFSITTLWNETAAYLAAQIYTNCVRPNDSVTSSSDPNIVAYNIVKTKGLGAKPCNGAWPIQFTDAEVKPLNDAIKTNKLYSSTWSSNAQFNGIK